MRTVFIAVVILAVVVFFLRRSGTLAWGGSGGGFSPSNWLPGRSRSISSLRREIFDLFGPMDDGEAILNRTLYTLKRLHPDKPERWYYEKALEDLKRDRGRY